MELSAKLLLSLLFSIFLKAVLNEKDIPKNIENILEYDDYEDTFNTTDLESIISNLDKRSLDEEINFKYYNVGILMASHLGMLIFYSYMCDNNNQQMCMRDDISSLYIRYV